MMQNGIDPKVSAILNIVVAVIGAIVAATAQLTTLFGQSNAQTIVTVGSLVVTVITAINGALHNYASTAAGPGVINK